MAQRFPISIVIPSFNGLKLLKKNLPAVLKIANKGDEVLIIEDAGTDETEEWLKQEYSLRKHESPSGYSLWETPRTESIQLSLIVNHHNLRFASSCNRAISLAHHEYFFLMNNDVQPLPGVIEAAMPHFQDPAVFAVGCYETENDRHGQVSGKNQLWFEKGLFVHSRAAEFSTGDTAWASGGSAFFDRQKWLKLKGFSPRYYPAYWEDIDVSYRARQRGWKVVFEAEAKVIHRHETTNASTFGQKKIEQMSLKNAITFVWSNGSWWQKFQHLCWLPYHLIVTNWRTKGSFLAGYWQFLR